MKKYKKIVLIIITLLSFAGTAGAQATVDDAIRVATRLYKAYDSIPYITFDAKYRYFTDTVYSDYTNEVMKSQYTLNGRKARYTVGDVEYLQNDSILIAVYHKDQMMVVSNPVAANTGSYAPMREALDSLLTVYAEHYSISILDENTTGTSDTVTRGYLKMEKKKFDTVAQYNHFLVEFSMPEYVITKIEYEYTEKGQGVTELDEPDAALRLLRNADRKKTLSIEMFNYRFDHMADSDYSENNFVWEEDGEYKPIEKFKDYKVYNARN